MVETVSLEHEEDRIESYISQMLALTIPDRQDEEGENYSLLHRYC
jgi:hypothetical protein